MLTKQLEGCIHCSSAGCSVDKGREDSLSPMGLGSVALQGYAGLETPRPPGQPAFWQGQHVHHHLNPLAPSQSSAGL